LRDEEGEGEGGDQGWVEKVKEYGGEESQDWWVGLRDKGEGGDQGWVVLL
jgi:hypothetical protein